MSDAGVLRGPWADERGQSSRLARAFVFSLLLHLLVFGTYKMGNKLGWWQSVHWPQWLQSSKMLAQLIKKKENSPPPPPRELPLMFVDVSPEQVTPEPPKDARFYSSKNSQAANPDSIQDTDQPKIDGKQKQAVKTEDVPHVKYVPLQPSAPPTPPEPQKTEQAAKPEPQKTEQASKPDPPRPVEPPKPAEPKPE